MYKNFKNVVKYPSPDADASTSPAGGEVLNSVFNATTLNVMLACEHSELPRASRDIKAIFFKEENSIALRLFSVIFGLVPKILLQQVTNQVKKFAILLKRSLLNQDCRNASGNDWCWRREPSAACYIASVLVITESVIFSAKPCKYLCGGRKSAFNQMFRICRERERDLCLAYFSSFSSLYFS